MGWFLRTVFVDLLGACSLSILSKSHSITFLLINMQKTKTCPQCKKCSKGYLGNSSLLRLVLRKDRPKRFPFITTINWIVLAFQWSVKRFFAPNSPIFWKRMWQRRRRRRLQLQRGNCKALCFSSKRTNIALFLFSC